jgi:hypothetical protein
MECPNAQKDSLMKRKTLFLLLVLAFAAVTNAKASLNLYIKTDPALPGEVATPVAWVDAWEVLSFSIGVSTPVQHSATGFTSGSPAFSDLSLQKCSIKHRWHRC